MPNLCPSLATCTQWQYAQLLWQQGQQGAQPVARSMALAAATSLADRAASLIGDGGGRGGANGGIGSVVGGGTVVALHERIARSGLPFKQARFRFTPHCTLSFYPTLTSARERELLSLRVNAPAIIERLQVYLTRDPQPSKLLFDIALTGELMGSACPAAASGTLTSRA